MTTNKIKLYNIDNVCEENDYFLLESLTSQKVKATLIISQNSSDRKELWEYLKEKSDSTSYYILSDLNVPNTKRSQIWMLKNRLWEKDTVSQLLKRNIFQKKNVSYCVKNDCFFAFFWVQVDIKTQYGLLNKLLDTDRFFLISADREINSQLDLLIKNGWHYNSVRSMQIPEKILSFVLTNNLKSVITLGRFDDRDKDILVVGSSFL